MLYFKRIKHIYKFIFILFVFLIFKTLIAKNVDKLNECPDHQTNIEASFTSFQTLQNVTVVSDFLFLSDEKVNSVIRFILLTYTTGKFKSTIKIILIVLFTLITFIFFLLKKYITKQKANKVLYLQNQELQIQKDLYANALIKLRESDEKIRGVFENPFIGFAVCDPEGRFLLTNPAFDQMLKYSPSELQNYKCNDILCHEDIPEVGNVLSKIRNKEIRNYVFEKELMQKDGTLFWSNISLTPISDHSDIIKSITIIIQDITPVINALNALAISESKYRMLAENTSDVIWTMDLKRNFTYVSPSIQNILGYSHKNLKAFRLEKILTPKSLDKANYLYDRLINSLAEDIQHNFSLNDEFEIIKRNKEKVWIEVALTPLPGANGEVEGIIGISRNINQRKLTELKYSETLEFLQNLIYSIPNPIFAKDDSGYYIACNNAFAEYLGKSKDEIIGYTVFEILPKKLAKKLHDYELEITKSKADVSFEDVIQHASDSQRSVIFYLSTFTMHENGNRVLIGVIVDITEHKHIEEELSHAKSEAEHANLAKSRFLAQMSHEIRTPMQGIVGIIELMEQTRLSKQQSEFIELMRIASNNLMGIISDILDISKIEAGKFELEVSTFNLVQSVSRVLKPFKYQAKIKGLNFSFNISRNIPKLINGDPLRLNQIIINLVGNALKFTNSGSIKVNIKIEKETVEKLIILFAIKDTGIGIPKNNLVKIFEDFSQAGGIVSKKYGGSGLGLPIAKSLIEMMGGTIRVESTKNKGSVFYFSIPFSKIQSNFQPILKISPEIHQNTVLRILLAEDDPINQKLASNLLRRLNHSVTIANNGNEVLKLVDKKEFDCILMDIHMPKLNGIETAIAIRAKETNKRKRIPIIALTADVMTENKKKIFDAGIDGFAPKPFKIDKLMEMIFDITAEKKSKKEKKKKS